MKYERGSVLIEFGSVHVTVSVELLSFLVLNVVDISKTLSL